MALISCKKCNHIFSAQAATCPYCGTANPDAARGVGINHFKHAGLGIFFLVLLAGILLLNVTRSPPSSNNNEPVAAVAPAAISCLLADCPVGTQAVTHTSQQAPFYTCKSREFTEYANRVVSIMVSHTLAAGVAPEISRATGEPVTEGSEQKNLDVLRTRAGVKNFEEALAKCYTGRSGLLVMVLSDPKDSDHIFVAAEENHEDKFWLPKARLEPR